MVPSLAVPEGAREDEASQPGRPRPPGGGGSGRMSQNKELGGPSFLWAPALLLWFERETKRKTTNCGGGGVHQQKELLWTWPGKKLQGLRVWFKKRNFIHLRRAP